MLGEPALCRRVACTGQLETLEFFLLGKSFDFFKLCLIKFQTVALLHGSRLFLFRRLLLFFRALVTLHPDFLSDKVNADHIQLLIRQMGIFEKFFYLIQRQNISLLIRQLLDLT